MSVTYKHTFNIANQTELPALATQLIALCKNISVWCFTGEMGVGKTTLIKEICTQLGVVDEMSSPTFSIVNEYHTGFQKKLYHFDLYRLKNENELFGIGFEEYVDSGNFCFIEWPEIAQNVLKGVACVNLLIEAKEETRTIQVTTT